MAAKMYRVCVRYLCFRHAVCSAILCGVILCGVFGGVVPGTAFAEGSIRYNRDIRPLLSDHCFGCHGPDSSQRRAGLRLDLPPPEVAKSESGLSAIVAGRPSASELLRRVESDDPAVVMPPPETYKFLNAEQKSLLRRWIEQGAAYEAHWAYVAPNRPALPPVADASWPWHPIDRFIRVRLEREGLAPSREADRSTLLRRVSLDLTGLPPSRAEIEAYLQDSAPDAYERVVDRLLSAEKYGERMAVDWLDAARYADTNGYQIDRDREQHAYRDWVIGAFNRNMPFDQFTIDQLAGDLLPAPTRDQRIATGFHRNHMVNEETGSIPEEFLAEYASDRVETTATVWLGQTFNCARCHDHKFDPITQRDYYGLKAFFHNISENGIADYEISIRQSNPPFLWLTTAEQEMRRAELRQQVVAAEAVAAAVAKAAPDAAAQEPGGGPQPAASIPAATGGAAGERGGGESDRLTKLHAELAAYEAELPTTLVMQELPQPRPTYVLERGAYDRPGAAVAAATPAMLPAMGAELPQNRLGLALWLVDAENPLTARVIVNRFWQSLFGTGLVVTSDDFGAQGSPPSHPELLDWLAVEFVESGWNVKRMLRLMVTSAAYRQASHGSPELRARDPENRLLARGPRFRLQAEFLRDQALAASGLLVAELGGPSVKPYHPPGLYEQVVSLLATNKGYPQGVGDDLHRRSLYTYWKRSVPHPAMLAFDAGFRETCAVRRTRTNTPLQALVLMNDPTYVEAARFLAARMMSEGGDGDAPRIAHGFWLMLGRAPDATEIAVLQGSLEAFRAQQSSSPELAQQLLEVGAPLPADALRGIAEKNDLPAFTLLASMLICCDEAVMRN